MFTGIIEDFGVVKKVSTGKLSIQTKLDDIKLGDSISINGVCLTVTGHRIQDIGLRTFSVDVADETYKKTNLGKLKPKDKVNLERALRADSRLGGHIVTGHVEFVSKILKIQNTKSKSKVFVFSYPEESSKYIVPKGSISIDGISLTIVEVKKTSFSVSVIPHTLTNATLGFKKVNDTVNIEPDILAKYVQQQSKSQQKSKVSWDLLKKTGFL